MKILGSTIAGAFSGADRAIFGGLAERGAQCEVLGARLSAPARAAILLTTFSPNWHAWGLSWYDRRIKSVLAFRSRTRYMDRELRSRAAEYDLVLHVGGLFAPFRGSPPRPVALFCDYTSRLAARNYPKWFHLRGEEARAWFALETSLYQNASVILTASENTRRSFIDDYGIAENHVRVVGEGTGQTYAHPDGTYARHRILFVALDFERKGGLEVLSAFARAREVFPDATLRIVGPAPRESQPGVEWLGEVRDRSQLEELYSSSSLFAMPSHCEPFGLALIEAMAHGLPVIGTRVDAMAEIVKDESTGLLVRAGSSEDLTTALVRLLGDPELCSRMGQAGRARVEERFLWRQAIGRIETGLREVYAGSKG